MKNTKKLVSIVLCLLLAVSLFAGGTPESSEPVAAEEAASQVKYVFMFIGDGMALPQINAAEAYLQAAEGSEIGAKLLNFSTFPAQGLTTTYANNSYITDSAAAATALATGYKTNSGVISMDPAASNSFKTIAEMAAEKGMKVGIVSSVSLDHATPACFYAHEPSRNSYYNIGIQAVNSFVNYFGGGTFRLGKAPKDKPNQEQLFIDGGWKVVNTRNDMEAIPAGTDKVYAYNTCFVGDALRYELDRETEDISLAEFTAKGIELLDNENGFFMMVEGGKIDWACHANDAASAIKDTIAFADAIQKAIDFYNAHPDETLIIVTGDHECGGLTIGFAGTKYASAFTGITAQENSFEYFNKFVLTDYVKAGNTTIDGLLPAIKEYFGLSDFSEYEMSMIEKAYAQTIAGEEEKSSDEETYLLYGGYTPITMQLTHIVGNRAGLAWTSYSHTGVPVPTFALGAGSDLFNGYYDNTDVFKKTVVAMGL